MNTTDELNELTEKFNKELAHKRALATVAKYRREMIEKMISVAVGVRNKELREELEEMCLAELSLALRGVRG